MGIVLTIITIILIGRFDTVGITEANIFDWIGVIVSAIFWVTLIFRVVLDMIIENKVEDDFIYMKRKDFMKKYEGYLEEE